MPRAVFDTNVLVTALSTPSGASARLLLELRAGAFEVVVSPMLLTELREVLGRQEFRRYVSAVEADAYVELIGQDSIVYHDPAPSAVGPIAADPDDQFLIDLARMARVDALVSGDRHLLDLRHAAPVFSPRELLASIGDD